MVPYVRAILNWLDDHLCADAIQMVKGSGSLSASGVTRAYLKNLTAASEIPIIYVYDAVGDTQGEQILIKAVQINVYTTYECSSEANGMFGGRGVFGGRLLSCK